MIRIEDWQIETGFRLYYYTNRCDFVLNLRNNFLCLFLLFVYSYRKSLSVMRFYRLKQFIGFENS